MNESLPPLLSGETVVKKNKPNRLLVVIGSIVGLMLVGFVILFVGIYFIFGENKSGIETTGAKSGDYTIEVSAWQLFAEYAANEIRADNTFKRRTVVVSGVIEGIGKDILGQPYVVLSTGQLLGQVQCVLTSTAAQTAASLNVGQVVSLKGVVSGKMMNVVVDDCTFVTAPANVRLLLNDPTTTSQLENAVADGNVIASRRLGLRHFSGIGVGKDREKGLMLLRSAAEHGDRDAASFLGATYSAGDGIPKNMSEGFKWSRKAAEEGDAISQYNLALDYLKGEGVSENRDTGLGWLRKSAAQGNAGAQDLLSKVSTDFEKK